jgi:uncharacterized protein
MPNPKPLAFTKPFLQNHTPAEQIIAIDVHAHYGVYRIPKGECHPLKAEFYTGDAKTVARRAQEARTQWTVVSPLTAILPTGQGQVLQGNDEAAKVVPATPGFLQWVVIDPQEPDSYAQAKDMLAQPHCVGIKIHGEMHQYSTRRYAPALFEFAAKHKAVVLAHSGCKTTLPGHFVDAINQFPEAKLILAHLGHAIDGDPTHQVRAIQSSKHGNIYVDTSSANSLLPNLIEWAVKEVGVDKILYGTDTPLYAASMMRARIDHADLTLPQKRAILRENAVRLLKLKS